jgi:hypothetical protein
VTGVGRWGDRVGLSTALSVTVMATALIASLITLLLRKEPSLPPLACKDGIVMRSSRAEPQG